ncbi:MAG: hypothetical protein MZV65_29815 [Chromatiales bacterium]|nr:hypothetical protein [Chromatiales bacterium]
MLLATDGDFNVGTVSFEALKRPGRGKAQDRRGAHHPRLRQRQLQRPAHGTAGRRRQRQLRLHRHAQRGQQGAGERNGRRRWKPSPRT